MSRYACTENVGVNVGKARASMLAHLYRRGCKTKQTSKYTSACDVGEDLKNVSKCASALMQEWRIEVTSEQVCVRLKCRGKCKVKASKCANAYNAKDEL